MDKPILVTGSHRSGSTWVGKMLALSPRVGYISEPFNPKCRPGVCNARFQYWFTYGTPEMAPACLPALLNTLNFRFDLAAEVQELKLNPHPSDGYSPEELKMLENYVQFVQHHLNRSVPLLKDPIAFFSSEWFHQTFGARIIVLIRHPAAFASSLKRLDWNFPFDHLMAQPALLDTFLAPFVPEIDEFAKQKMPLVDQAALVWKCVYSTAKTFQQKHPQWIFLRHEDLSLAPVEGFGQLYESLGLSFTMEIESAIVQHSRPDNPREWRDGESPHTFRLDSRANLQNWKRRLSREEILRVRKRVGETSDLYYSEKDWRT